jgi:hypothetical protein
MRPVLRMSPIPTLRQEILKALVPEQRVDLLMQMQVGGLGTSRLQRSGRPSACYPTP